MITARTTIIDFLNRNKLLIAMAMTSVLLSNLLSVLLPVSIGKFYELAFNEQSAKGRLIDFIPFEIQTTGDFFIFFFSLVLLKTLFTFSEKFFIALVGERFSRDMREDTFARQLSHSLSSNALKSTGSYLLRYSGDMTAIQNFVTKGMLVFTGDIFFVICALSVLAYISIYITAIILSIFVLSILAVWLIGRQLKNVTRERRNQRSANLAFVSSRLNAFNTIKSFNRETPEKYSFNKRSKKLYELGVEYCKKSALVQSVVPAFFFGTLAIILFMIAQPDLESIYGLSQGDVFVFVLLFLYMQGVMRRLLKVNIIWQAGRVSLNKLTELLNLPSEIRNETETDVEFDGAIKFSAVSYNYNNKPVIKNLSFEILPNSITQLKGKQGSGKSTIIKLIQKLYEPNAGSIYIDDKSYNLFTPFEIRKHVAVVSDDAPLLGNTVFKAISYNPTPERKERAEKMLERLKINFDIDYKKSLDFRLEENGSNLSAGERMMLQFARALLTGKKIILLDDPFKNLDADYLKNITTQLNILKTKKTIVIIAENLPQGLIPDNIIEIKS